jgi:hypothetical protein
MRGNCSCSNVCAWPGLRIRYLIFLRAGAGLGSKLVLLNLKSKMISRQTGYFSAHYQIQVTFHIELRRPADRKLKMGAYGQIVLREETDARAADIEGLTAAAERLAPPAQCFIADLALDGKPARLPALRSGRRGDAAIWRQRVFEHSCVH